MRKGLLPSLRGPTIVAALMSGGIRPSTIMPRPGTAGHSLIPEPPATARDLSVMGTSALASLVLSGNSATASEVLADPTVLQ